MEFDFTPWLNLAIRWLHFITGIAWIGSSFYFIWLDNHLESPKEPKKGMSGELWSVHGGGFYHKQKYAVAPEQMPENLHWFKWEAYFTWMSGFALLAVIYYLGADLFLIDKSKMDLTQFEAIGISLAFLVGGWVFYDGLCRSPLGTNNTLTGIIWFAALTAAAYALTHIFSDRAAFIHIGAIVGTAMAANVFMVIIPNQKKVVSALTAGETPDPKLGQMGKQRSLHNNYMTLPVLFLMISNHYPMTFSSPYNWVVVAAIGLVGVMVRHFFNLRHKGKTSPALVVASVVLFLAIAFFAAEAEKASRVEVKETVTFGQVQAVLGKHCNMCHAAAPTHEFFPEAPGGVMFDTADQVVQYAPKIMEQAVMSDIMPLGNETGMTDEERALLGKWIEDGARR
ncbi:urate hydroxylase PuuD [Kordiimonas lipolytica]|uniref:Urate hydroxylase PuuD n=1 Tax=Kordiimonas lipolytica TaxID=1662421 RepID=A0ABV8U6I5_9PROT|nr:urate hydroxylase PuuD [Kordiimonas lipolytica]